jgi:hypothetical protein
MKEYLFTANEICILRDALQNEHQRVKGASSTKNGEKYAANVKALADQFKTDSFKSNTKKP